MEKKDNSGALFKSANKEKTTDSDYNGSAIIDGREYWINAWLNKSKKGESYMGLRFKPKGAFQKSVPQSEPVYIQPNEESEIPF